jgi:transcriptional regulator with XRE-family HTH domain/ADP-ribosylglycohydrolase
MNIGVLIAKLRLGAGLSQDKLAQSLNVTRQAVQKWESGGCPDVEHIAEIAKFFNVSVDALISGGSNRITDEFVNNKKIFPEYALPDKWELYMSELELEYRQSIEEGKDISQYEGLFKAAAKMPSGRNKEKISDVIFDIVLNAPQVDGYKYNEPSDLEEIKLLRPKFEYTAKNRPGDKALKDKIRGAWLGRICGCLLGKPVEGISTGELRPLLKETGNFPMFRYIKADDITEEMYGKYKFNLKGKCFADKIPCAPADDDTNYTVLYNTIVEKYTRDFTPFDVSRGWLDYQPQNAYCTAERVAFRNFVNHFIPPHSAVYKNPYREWIGAQIRGDYFGYINLGDPEAAAEMAWRDASVSHIKNGIYGEMFVSAMLAYAAVNDGVEEIIRGGLAQIPETSRLYEAIMGILDGFGSGVAETECFDKIHTVYNEHDHHHWCHTISNAMIVTAALLYGGGNYGKSVCKAVQAGFDTDCNGATVGSVLGMCGGAGIIGEEWTKPLNGELDTQIFGAGRVKIEDMVEKTVKHLKIVV